MLLNREATTDIVRDIDAFDLQGFQKGLFYIGRAARFSQEFRLFSKLGRGFHRSSPCPTWPDEEDFVSNRE
jgi:hypothetical protein